MGTLTLFSGGILFFIGVAVILLIQIKGELERIRKLLVVMPNNITKDKIKCPDITDSNTNTDTRRYRFLNRWLNK